MARSMYKIGHVEQGYEEYWRKFWVTNEHSHEVLAAHCDGRLWHTEYIEASNLNEAMRMFRKKHPGFTAMPGGSGRIGGAS